MNYKNLNLASVQIAVMLLQSYCYPIAIVSSCHEIVIMERQAML